MEFMEIEKDETKKAEWLEKRKHYVTGTDAAKLLGLTPSSWGSAFTVFMDKTGSGTEIVPSEAMKWGLRLESDILKAYAEDTDSKVEHVDGYNLKTCDAYPRIACSLDGWNHTMNCPVDAKNIRWKDEKWGEAWTSDIPDYYKAQLQVQMMVTGAREAHLAVLFSGQQFVTYKMDFDEELESRIVKAADTLWASVESGVAPVMDGADATSDYIKEKYAVGDKDKAIEPTDEIKWLVSKYVAARDAEKDAKAEKELYANRIKGIMEDATVVTGYCTWKNNKDSVKTDYDAVAKELLGRLGDDERKDIIAKYTTTSPGNRVLKITAKGVSA